MPSGSCNWLLPVQQVPVLEGIQVLSAASMEECLHLDRDFRYLVARIGRSGGLQEW